MLYLQRGKNGQKRKVGPFVSDTDGTTPMTGLTIANTDIRLSKDGGDFASKNSGGATHDEAGWYDITFDSVDSETLGSMQLQIKMPGALSVYHDIWVMRNNQIIDYEGSNIRVDS